MPLKRAAVHVWHGARRHFKNAKAKSPTMFVKKDVRLDGNQFEEKRVDVMLKQLRANRGEPIIEDTVRGVEYQPKGYLRVLKTKLKGDI